MNKQDNITALLLAIFQRANPLEPQTSVAEYLDYFEFDIDRLGRLLRFLGLAEKSKQCDLGWTPNTRLMRMIGERAARPVEECGKVVVTRKIATLSIRSTVSQLAMYWQRYGRNWFLLQCPGDFRVALKSGK